MKKSMLVLLLLLALVMTFASVVPASAYTTWYVKTDNGGKVNVREGPSKSYKSIGKLPYGQAVAVESWVGNWACIVYGSYGDAFISGDCLSATKPSKKQTTTSDDDYSAFKAADYYITVKPTRDSGYVNLRWAPSTSSKSQGPYYKGYKLHVIAEGKKWLQVYDEENNRCGFMAAAYTTKVTE